MIRKKAFAKLDLAIHITPNKSKDSYYPVDYIVCQINLFDELLIEKKEQDIEIICNKSNVPKNKENFIYQAAQLLKEIKGDKKLGAKITLVKNIPIRAGFGGGSSDAATNLQALQKLWKIKLTQSQISNLAKKLGKDFYYSLHGGLCEVQGKGKNYKVFPLSSKLPKFWLLIIVPLEQKPSTGWVYEHLNPKSIGQSLDRFKRLKKAIYENDKKNILENLHNDFENSVSSYFPVVKKIKEYLIKAGASAALMAGAGLSVVGFFESEETATSVKKKLRGRYKQVIITKPIN